MKFAFEIINEKTRAQRLFEGSWQSEAEMNEEIKQVLNKGQWGAPQRIVHNIELERDPWLKNRVLRTVDENYVEVMSECRVIRYNMPDYAEKRQREYPSIDECVEALMENMEGRPEKLRLLQKRRAKVRKNYPKEIKEILNGLID